MTLNADEELEHVRSKIEIERKEKAKRINSIFTHVSESREEARWERRNAEPVNVEGNGDAEKHFMIVLAVLLVGTVLMGLGLFTIGRFIVEHFRG